MAGHDDWSDGTKITPEDHNDHLDHDGAVDGDDFYKVLPYSEGIVISGFTFYKRNGTSGKVTTYTDEQTALQAAVDAIPQS